MAIDPLVGTVVRVLPSGQSHDLSQRFTGGQIIRGIVLRALPEGKTLVNFAGQHLMLELGHPMVKGQAFLAAVEQSAPTLTLKVISDPARMPGFTLGRITSRKRCPKDAPRLAALSPSSRKFTLCNTASTERTMKGSV